MAFRFGSGGAIALRGDAFAAAARKEAKADRIIDRADRAMHNVVMGLEVGGTAFAFGVLNGKVGGGGAVVMGAPADLIGAIIFHGIGFFGKKYGTDSAHWHAFGNGALGSYMSTLGAKVGNNWKVKGKIFGVDGEDETTGGGSLADEELARMVRPAA